MRVVAASPVTADTVSDSAAACWSVHNEGRSGLAGAAGASAPN
jgi:hypothetical protein